MKRILGICFAFMLLFCMCVNVQAEGQTPFDKFADGDIIIVERGYYKENRLAGKISAAGQKEMFQTMIQAWCNLLRYEVDQGAKENDTMAAEIYRGFKNGYADGAFCATGRYSELINAVFGTSSKKNNTIITMYWLEWNTDTQVIRAAKKEMDAKSPIRSDRDIMDDPTFKNYAQSAWMDFFSMDPVQSWWDTRSDFVKFMNQLYSRANKGKKPNIK